MIRLLYCSVKISRVFYRDQVILVSATAYAKIVPYFLLVRPLYEPLLSFANTSFADQKKHPYSVCA